ncbi:MAG TPA: CBS domain-containing protein [Burkholderiales bacterium]|nr:CBS domain-containing protein [Burkholderiales bacterium]
MQVKDILKIKGDELFSIAPSASLSAAVKIMVERDIGSLVVMEAGAMQGLLTFREVLAASNAQGDLSRVKIVEVMVENPLTGDPEDTVDTMRQLMTDHHVRYLPIVREGTLLGILSFHDVARAALRAVSFENKLLKQYIKNWPE